MNEEPAQKKLHGIMKIGTHNGSFHCDEVLACFLLKQLDQYKDAEIVRFVFVEFFLKHASGKWFQWLTFPLLGN